MMRSFQARSFHFIVRSFQSFSVKLDVKGAFFGFLTYRTIDALVSAHGPHGMHFQHSGAKIKVFEQSIDMIKFWLFYSVIAQKCSIFLCVHFLLANIYEQEILSCYEPLVQLLN